ncbi:hypothetical protein BASA81_018253 [Batrachochytrium salamandrivorans]|nr:hypothetical protein BASA81_018253 [Batrachochytrium salamandrivorans]
MHDGFFVRIQDGVDADFINKNFIDNGKLTNVVMEEFGIDMKFKVKEHDLSLVDLLQTVSNEYPSYAMMKKDFEETHCKIIKKSFFVEKDSEGTRIFSEKNLSVSYKHLMCISTNNEGEEVRRPFISQWLTDPEMRVYEDIGIYPDETLCPPDVLNMWTEFTMEKVGSYTHDQESLDIILTHIRILCGNEESVFDYFCKWIGQMIQYPAVKSICPTLISKQGAGKGLLIQLLRKMLGSEKVMESTNPSRDVWGQFNSQMADTFLVNLNELSRKDTFDSEGRIKGLITDNTLIINDKGISAYPVQSYHRFIITTNSSDPIATSQDDRRNFIIRSSDEKVGNREYFDAILAVLEDANAIKTCYEYFKCLPGLDKFHSIELPRTGFHDEIITASESPVEHWIKHLVCEYKGEEEVIRLDMAEALKLFDAHCERHKFKHEVNSLKLAKQISSFQIAGVGVQKTMSKNYRTFDRNQIMEHYKIQPMFADSDEDEEEAAPRRRSVVEATEGESDEEE